MPSRSRILVVDDDRDIVYCMRALLEQKGYKVDVFEQPELALKNLSAGKYDIVIADIKMPKISGFEFARQIDSIDKSTKIILMTAFQLKKEEFEKVVPSTRVDAFIKKPIGMTKLIDHIETLSRDRSMNYSIASIGMSVAISLVSASSEAASILL